MASVHLLVLIHGMWGHPGHLSELYRVISEKYITESTSEDHTSLRVLLAETNREDSTYDGIDWGGERVAQEVAEEVKRVEEEGSKVTKFSVTGYSLGGLIARYLVGILEQRDFFKDITPVNFNTIATPHLGLPRYSSFFSRLTSFLGPKLLSRTGEQFYCVDKWSPKGEPLLEVMADPERIFYRALNSFQHIRIYANTINDRTVPYVTAAIETNDPFVGHTLKGLSVQEAEGYTPVLDTYMIPPVPPPQPPKPRLFSLAWFRSFRQSKPFLPPFLQFRFPLNIVFYISLPLLIPMFVIFLITRFSLSARSSRQRIRLLEKDSTPGHHLAHIIAQLEQDVEDAVIDRLHIPRRLSSAGSTTSRRNSDKLPSTRGGVPPQNSDVDAEVSDDPLSEGARFQSLTRKGPDELGQPILSPVQLKIAGSLNRLPGLKKELVFLDNVVNSHAVIVCRDVKRFEGHKAGLGVLKHWADVFIL